MGNKMDALSKKHFQYIKAVAILAVIISHIGNFSGKTWFTPLGGIGVAMFLFCSGYGLLMSYYQKGLIGFWKNKFVAIYVPFAIVQAIAAIILRHPIGDVALDFIFIKRLNPLGWYLQYLVVCYIAFYVVVRWIPNISIRFAVWGTIAVLSFILCPNLQAEQAISFFCGLLVAEMSYRNRIFPINKKTVMVGIIALLVSIGLLAIKQLPVARAQSHYVTTVLNLLLKSSAAMGIICITMVWAPIKKVIMWVGSISYPLYLVHGYFMPIIGNNRFGNYYINSIVMLLISFALAIGLHILTKLFIKRKENMYDTKSISNQQ